jgi:hypothetical protein
MSRRPHACALLALFALANAQAEPALEPRCALMERIADATDDLASSAPELIAPRLAATLESDFGAQCQAPTAQAMRTCIDEKSSPSVSYRVFDQSGQNSNGVSLAWIIVDFRGVPFDHVACLSGEPFVGWVKSQVTPGACRTLVWRVSKDGRSTITLQAPSTSTCTGSSDELSITMTKGRVQFPAVR